MLNFDTFPITYAVPVYILCWLLLILTVWPSVLSVRWFLISAFVLLFLLRLPSIVYNQEIDADESQIITQAMTLRLDPIYFRAVDGTTGGPLDSYFLIVPTFLGLPFDYITAHLTAFLLLGLTLLPLFATAKLWFGPQAARVALLPFLWLLGLTQQGDFLHYSSELIAVMLLGWASYLYAGLVSSARPSLKQIALLGLLLGMVPLGKLQGTPLAGVVGLFAVMHILTYSGWTLTNKSKGLACLILGSSLVPIAFIGFTMIYNVYGDFITFYLQANLNYSANNDFFANLQNLPGLFRKDAGFDGLVKLTGLIWLVTLLVHGLTGREKLNWNWRVGGFLLALFFAGLYAITRTGSNYGHYLFFLVGPLLLWLAYGCHQLLLGSTIRHQAWLTASLMAVFLLAFSFPLASRYRQGQPLNAYPSDQQGGWQLPQSAVAKVIRQYTRAGDKLAVWGWRCDYYVQTQLAQGVAENHTIRSCFNHPLRGLYQRRYVSDLLRSQPRVFVDAVGSHNLWMRDRATQGYESCRLLKLFIERHYQYVGLVDDSRIYVRRDRLTSPANPRPAMPLVAIH
ncbi:hypothetical protein [Spirosoma validum]|uniref:Uncharacterized protein n=1 Tax=Spirosoma validum TaxID=2771355 RepID=A0A927GHF3_9BACT|nr:hypothetical protein [Spirosoma validum]MBD2757884.1 hypothetical protein [Spirosoma validum]